MWVHAPLTTNLFDCRRIINRINPIFGAVVFRWVFGGVAVGAVITVHGFHFNSGNSRSRSTWGRLGDAGSDDAAG